MPRSTRTLACVRLSVLVVGALLGCTAQPAADPLRVYDAAAEAPVPVETIPAGETTPPAGAPPSRPAWAVDPDEPRLSGRSLAQIRDSPALLADRRLPTPELLPPPEDEQFRATVAHITPAIRARMGKSWVIGCPVRQADLRYLTMTFRGFDGRAHTGDMIVHAKVVDTVVAVFERLYDEDFPIEEMRLVTTADHDAPLTGDGNVTAAYNCRKARGQGRWSAHAYGTSVDINPFQNPMVRGSTVIPELASAYVDRTRVRPGMLTAGGPAVRAFTEAGWVWGGDWTYSKDYMHFSTDGS